MQKTVQSIASVYLQLYMRQQGIWMEVSLQGGAMAENLRH